MSDSVQPAKIHDEADPSKEHRDPACSPVRQTRSLVRGCHVHEGCTKQDPRHQVEDVEEVGDALQRRENFLKNNKEANLIEYKRNYRWPPVKNTILLVNNSLSRS